VRCFIARIPACSGWVPGGVPGVPCGVPGVPGGVPAFTDTPYALSKDIYRTLHKYYF
jgi:hypothetical protein